MMRMNHHPRDKEYQEDMDFANNNTYMRNNYRTTKLMNNNNNNSGFNYNNPDDEEDEIREMREKIKRKVVDIYLYNSIRICHQMMKKKCLPTTILSELTKAS